jgi:hypothetical protein
LPLADFEATDWPDRARFAGAAGRDGLLLVVLPGAFVAAAFVAAAFVAAAFVAAAFVAAAFVAVAPARSLAAGRSPGDGTGAEVRLASATVGSTGFVTVRKVRSATDSAAMPA